MRITIRSLTFILVTAFVARGASQPLPVADGTAGRKSTASQQLDDPTASGKGFELENELLGRMQRTVDWKLQGETVEALAERVRRELKAPVVIEWPDLEDVGVGREDTVTGEFCDLPLEFAFERALDRFDLVWTLTRNAIEITTEEGIELEARVYPVGDLLDRGKFKPVNLEELADVIVSTVSVETWAENGGGEAEIRPFDTGDSGMLIVSQTFAVHRQIAGLLEEMRVARASKESRHVPALSFDEFRERLLPLKTLESTRSGAVEETSEADRASLNQLATTEGLREAARRSNDFSLELMRTVAAKPGENFVLCAYGVREAMTLIALGANGEARSEIVKALRHPESVRLAAAESLAMRMHLSSTDRSKEQFSSANSLWIQTSLAADADFVALAEKAMNAALNPIDFQSPDLTAKEINNWISQQTGGKIRDAVTPSDFGPASVAAIVNATYFNGRWETPFKVEQTEPGDFALPNGEINRVAMMRGKVSARAATLVDSGLQVAELPYRGERMSAVILLPKVGVNELAHVEESLSAEALEVWLDALEEVDLQLSMPKFKLATRHELRQALQKLGVSKVFDDTSPDLKRIVAAPWALGQIFQSAVIEVDERGTEAAAATGGAFGGIKSMPMQTMVVDRPFLFLVRDVRSGCLLFSARVANPAE